MNIPRRPSALRRTLVGVVVAAWWMVSGAACTEALPAYEDPRDLLSAHLRATFSYRSDETVFYVSLVLVNSFDETLEGKVDVDGSIMVTLLRDPSTVRTFALTASNLTASHYVRSSGTLRLDPGDSVIFQGRYDFFDDTGRFLPSTVLRMQVDPTCPTLRVVSDRELYSIKGFARVFPRTVASVASDLGYVVCLPIPWLPDKVCLGPDPPEQTGLCP